MNQLFGDHLASTLVGGIAFAIAVILLATGQRSRGDLGLIGTWVFTSLVLVVTPVLAGGVDPDDVHLGHRLVVLLVLGAYASLPFYIDHLLETARSSAAGRRTVRTATVVGSVVGCAGFAVGAFVPDRLLNDFFFAFGHGAPLDDGGFWLFGVPLLISAAAFVVAWVALSREDLDPGERARAKVNSIAVVPLMSSVLLPVNAAITTFAVALALSLYAIVVHLAVQGQRAAFLSRFLSPQVAELVRLRGLAAVMRPQELVLSVVCIDFRGFTSYTEAVPTRTVIDLISEYHEAIAACVQVHDGMIKDYAGDGILILVGAPIAREDHRTAAVDLALDAMAAARGVTGRWATGPHPLGVGIGIASGRVTAGAIGETAQMEYTCVGTPVNLAARLCSAAEDGAILVDADVAAAIAPERLLPRGEIALKGMSKPVSVYGLDAAAIGSTG